MNNWKIEWGLLIPKDEVINLLHHSFHDAILTIAKPVNSKKKIQNNNFNILVKRSLVWGTAFRKEIEGKCLVVDAIDGSRISASLEVCAPYRYVSLNGIKLSLIVLIFILSWIGLIFASIWPESPSWLDYILIPLFVVTCSILLISFRRYVSIDDKFKELIKIFEVTFDKHRNPKS